MYGSLLGLRILSLCLSLLLLSIGLPNVTAAQSDLPEHVTVELAVQEAIEKNLSLLAERYNVSLAEAQIITARLRPNPVLTLSSGLPDHTIFHSGTNPFSEVAHVDFVFERGGKREARIAVAENARGVAQLQLLDTVRS